MSFCHAWKYSNNDHEYCIIDVVDELITRGYRCYLEYEVSLGYKGKTTTSHNRRNRPSYIAVDIYAVRDADQIVVEVGTLAPRKEGDRMTLLRKLFPEAKLVHVTQWKNFINTWEIQQYRFREYCSKFAWNRHYREENSLRVQEVEGEIEE
jgi:hypothetical protein